jgi:hypothetical protein
MTQSRGSGSVRTRNTIDYWISRESTMKPIESLRNSLRSTHEGPAWYALSIREILAEITATQADIRPDWPQTKTIWEQFGHILTGKVNLLETRTPEDLDRKIDSARAPYSMDFAISGLAQHDADHAGQIAVITKAIRPSPTPRIASDV